MQKKVMALCLRVQFFFWPSLYIYEAKKKKPGSRSSYAFFVSFTVDIMLCSVAIAQIFSGGYVAVVTVIYGL